MKRFENEDELFSVTCPKCGRKVTKATEDSSGLTICPECKTKFQYVIIRNGVNTLIVDNKSA